MVHNIQEYVVAFEYIPGKKNAAADTLSRNIRETQPKENAQPYVML